MMERMEEAACRAGAGISATVLAQHIGEPGLNPQSCREEGKREGRRKRDRGTRPEVSPSPPLHPKSKPDFPAQRITKMGVKARVGNSRHSYHPSSFLEFPEIGPGRDAQPCGVRCFQSWHNLPP